MAYRLIALAVALTVSASPAFAAICDSVCAELPTTVAEQGCHEQGDPDASTRLVASVHTCGHDGWLPTAPGTRAEQQLPMSMTHVVTATPMASPVEASVPLLPGGGPPEQRALVTPLRI